MEDLSEKETTLPQPEDRSTEAAEQAIPPTAADAAPEPQPAEEVQAAEQTPVAEAEGAQPAAVTEPTKPKEAPPARPTGPRLADLRPGAVVEGKVTRIERYGAFVDLGLVEKRDGLIHISELSPYRVRRVEDVVHIGDPVKARVVSVDLGRGRIALSLNDLEADQYDAEAASRANEPALTSMAAAFERAYGRQREQEGKRGNSAGREDRGFKMKREQELLMEKFRASRK